MRGPGAEACAGEPAVRAAVSARLGYDPFFAWAHDTVYADVERTGGQFHAVVKLVDDENRQRGAREIALRGDDCSPVIDAMGLTISLVIDPESFAKPKSGTTDAAPPAPSLPPQPLASPPTAETSGAPGAPGSPEAVTRERPSPPSGPGASQDTASDWSFQAGVTAVALLNAAPSPTAAAAFAVGARWRSLSLDLELQADYPATGDSAPGFRTWLFAGSVVPCAHLGIAFGCGVLGAGALGATAENGTSKESYGPWWALGGRVGAELPISPSLRLRAYLELLAVVVRDSVQADPTGPAYSVPPWSGGLGLGAAWRFR